MNTIPLRPGERLSMSSLFGPIWSKRKKAEGRRGGEMISTRHEAVYHATHGCQAASLSETSARLRGLFWACQVESQKNGGFLAHVESDQLELELLSRSASMLLLGLLKGGRLIALVMQPHGKDDPDPHIGQCSHSHGMAFAFCSFALVVSFGPRFTLRGLPGERCKALRSGLMHPKRRCALAYMPL